MCLLFCCYCAWLSSVVGCELQGSARRCRLRRKVVLAWWVAAWKSSSVRFTCRLRRVHQMTLMSGCSCRRWVLAEGDCASIFLQCFDTVGWVVWPIKTRPDMTYNVFDGTLSLTQSINHSSKSVFFVVIVHRVRLSLVLYDVAPHCLQYLLNFVWTGHFWHRVE